MIGATLGGLVAVSTLHATFVIPTVLSRVDGMIEAKIGRHESRGPHRGAVEKAEFVELSRRLEGLASKGDIDAINRRLDDFVEQLRAIQNGR